jgi:hypothetical protein
MKPVLTPLGKITGAAAIKFAEENGLKLCASATGMRAFNLTPDQATRMMAEGCEIWIVVGDEE